VPQSAPLIPQSTEEIEAARVTVNRKFKNLDTMVRGVALGKLNGLVVRGDGGIGKSYTVDAALKSLVKSSDEIDEEKTAQTRFYKRIPGHITSLQLYNTLFLHNSKDTILVFDDCDAVFKDMSCLNVLKACMDTNNPRVVAWGSSSSLVNVERYNFEGNIIILTNDRLNGDPHTVAFLDRVHSIDLTLSPLERVVRLSEVAMVIGKNKDMNETVINECVQWLIANAERLGKKISLRSFLKLCDLAHYVDDWKDLAEGTMLVSI
jgi:hypothetical protein